MNRCPLCENYEPLEVETKIIKESLSYDVRWLEVTIYFCSECGNVFGVERC